MRPQCIAAVSAAIGRELTRAEADGIEARVRAALRMLAVQDPVAFSAKSASTRLDEAAALAAQQIKQEAVDAKRQTLRQVEAHDRIATTLRAMIDAGRHPQDALRRTLYDIPDGKTSGLPLESRYIGLSDLYRRRLTDTLGVLEPRAFGLFANREGQYAFVREMFGVDTGNVLAKRAAETWTKLTQEELVPHFVDAGGVLHPLADYRFPQHHDQLAVFGDGTDASRDAWVADVMPALDRRRYVNLSGRLMDDGELTAVLRDVWDTISSGGANKIVPGEQVGAQMVANRELQHRFLHFRDPEHYLAYQELYGSRDLWSTVNGHVDRMARSIAQMETFGPNADREFAYWNAWAAKEGRRGRTDALATMAKLDNAYRQVAGYTEGVAHPGFARVMDDLRNLMAARALGSALWSSIQDLETIAMTARYNRVSVFGTYLNHLRLLAPGSSEGRLELERAGLLVNSGMQVLRRYQVDSLGASFSAKMANFVITISGLNRWTDAGRAAYAMMHARTLASLLERGALGAHDRQLLTEKGVTDTDLAVWKLANAEQTHFGRLLTPDAIYRIPDADLLALPLPTVAGVTTTAQQLKREAATKLLSVLITESRMAVVEPGMLQRAQMSLQAPRGDIKGELLRSFWQFKSFPWSFFQKHIVQRGWNGQDTAGGRIVYLGPTIIASTLLGAAALEINDMLLGKDPRPLYGADGQILTKNWIAAAAKGGGLGVYGDFLAAESTSDASSALATLAGPLASTAAHGVNLFAGNAVQALGNKPTNFGREGVAFVKGVTPGANLWYTKAATDHWLFNYLQEQLSPGYSARIEARARTQFGQDYWWRPRDLTPQGPFRPDSLIAGR
jgi:hypothetical protein